jgi:hypothetical protein
MILSIDCRSAAEAAKRRAKCCEEAASKADDSLYVNKLDNDHTVLSVRR